MLFNFSQKMFTAVNAKFVNVHSPHSDGCPAKAPALKRQKFVKLVLNWRMFAKLVYSIWNMVWHSFAFHIFNHNLRTSRPSSWSCPTNQRPAAETRGKPRLFHSKRRSCIGRNRWNSAIRSIGTNYGCWHQWNVTKIGSQPALL